MISSAEEYKFVIGGDVDESHPLGDLNRITIDGQIMPLRNDASNPSLRGEDIAFLLEAKSEIAYAPYGTDEGDIPKREFVHKLSRANVQAIPIQLDSGRWFRDSFTPSAMAYEVSGPWEPLLIRLYGSDIYLKAEDLVQPTYSSDKISREAIFNNFENLKKLKRFDAYGVFDVDPTEWNKIDDPDIGTSGDPFDPNPPYGDAGFMSYRMWSWGGRHQEMQTQGSRLWVPTNGGIFIQNKFAKSALAVIGFRVYDSDHDNARYYSVPMQMNENDSHDGFLISAGDIYSEIISTVLPALGITIRPYPGRQGEEASLISQDIAVFINEVAIIGTRRDRLRW